MPLGLDTPSTFGSVFLILGPAFAAAKGRGWTRTAAAREAWFVGIAMILASGVFKLACALFAGRIRRVVPRAGLLGSLSAIALVLISFLPLLDIARAPVAGMAALAVILVTLTARWRLPGNVPGALVAVVLGSLVYYAMWALGLGPGPGGGEMAGPRWRSGRPCRCRWRTGGTGSWRPGGDAVDTSRWRSPWPWRRSSAGSTAPRARRPWATTTRPARSSPPRGSPRSSPASSAG